MPSESNNATLRNSIPETALGIRHISRDGDHVLNLGRSNGCRRAPGTERWRALNQEPKSTSDNSVDRRAKWCAQIGAGCGAPNPTVQFEIQCIRGDRHLNNKGIFPLIGKRLTGVIK